MTDFCVVSAWSRGMIFLRVVYALGSILGADQVMMVLMCSSLLQRVPIPLTRVWVSVPKYPTNEVIYTELEYIVPTHSFQLRCLRPHNKREALGVTSRFYVCTQARRMLKPSHWENESAANAFWTDLKPLHYNTSTDISPVNFPAVTGVR